MRESLQRAIDDDPDREVRGAAAATLCTRRPPSPDEAFARSWPTRRRAAGDHAELAQAIAPGAADPTSDLITAWTDSDARVRAAVATTSSQTASRHDATAQTKSQAVAALAPCSAIRQRP